MLIHLNIILGTASSNKNPKQNCCHSNFNFEGLLKPNRTYIYIKYMIAQTNNHISILDTDMSIF